MTDHSTITDSWTMTLLCPHPPTSLESSSSSTSGFFLLLCSYWCVLVTFLYDTSQSWLEETSFFVFLKPKIWSQVWILSSHSKSVSKSYWLSLDNNSRIWTLPTTSNYHSGPSHCISRLDYFNNLKNICWIYVFYASTFAPTIDYFKPKPDDIILWLRTLQWFPSSSRIKTKPTWHIWSSPFYFFDLTFLFYSTMASLLFLK